VSVSVIFNEYFFKFFEGFDLGFRNEPVGKDEYERRENVEN